MCLLPWLVLFLRNKRIRSKMSEVLAADMILYKTRYDVKPSQDDGLRSFVRKRRFDPHQAIVVRKCSVIVFEFATSGQGVKTFEIKRREDNVVMVRVIGDGVNDASALMAAHIGMITGSRSDKVVASICLMLLHTLLTLVFRPPSSCLGMTLHRYLLPTKYPCAYAQALR